MPIVQTLVFSQTHNNTKDVWGARGSDKISVKTAPNCTIKSVSLRAKTGTTIEPNSGVIMAQAWLGRRSLSKKPPYVDVQWWHNGGYALSYELDIGYETDVASNVPTAHVRTNAIPLPRRDHGIERIAFADSKQGTYRVEHFAVEAPLDAKVDTIAFLTPYDISFDVSLADVSGASSKFTTQGGVLRSEFKGWSVYGLWSLAVRAGQPPPVLSAMVEWSR